MTVLQQIVFYFVYPRQDCEDIFFVLVLIGFQKLYEFRISLAGKFRGVYSYLPVFLQQFYGDGCSHFTYK